MHARTVSSVSDSDLDEVAHQLKEIILMMIAAHLKSIGIHVPRSRLRASIHHTDPCSRDCLRPVIRRHSPNSVTVIIKRIFVHSGIDGYSRLLTRNMLRPLVGVESNRIELSPVMNAITSSSENPINS